MAKDRCEQKPGIAKALLAEKKIKIFRSIHSVPKTIKTIAQELNEEPSRLYHHIKKPETIGLIEAVKEGQAGNMTQKYYLAKQIDGSQFT
jgi:DNA-binding transcriptional ArsR family regulator